MVFKVNLNVPLQFLRVKFNTQTLVRTAPLPATECTPQIENLQPLRRLTEIVSMYKDAALSHAHGP